MKKTDWRSVFFFSKNLAYAEHSNSMLWTKDNTFFIGYCKELLTKVVGVFIR